MGGAAGALLACLALYDATRDTVALDRARDCAQHLLDTRVPSHTGHYVWRTIVHDEGNHKGGATTQGLPLQGNHKGLPLTGFSHGASGFAYALLRLDRAAGEGNHVGSGGNHVESGGNHVESGGNHVGSGGNHVGIAPTGQPQEIAPTRAAAEDALAYESALFDPSENNWPDLRGDRTRTDPSAPAFMVAWCHGAAGIGLARIGILEGQSAGRQGGRGAGEQRRDIDAALTATQRALEDSAWAADHLCCGNAGRIEFLLSAGLALHRPDLVARAKAYARQLIANAARLGGFGYTSFTPRGTIAPGLFEGAAGIGYTLLRLAHPDRLPNVLLWE
jgi:lantibiotic modifying enzyme